MSLSRKKLDLYFFNFEFKKDFDKIFTTNTETNFFHNIDANNIKSFLLY